MAKAKKKYTITCTEEQLRLIAHAVEDWHRFLCGQCEMQNAISMLECYHELYDVLDSQVRPLVVPELNVKYGRGASYDWAGNNCPNENQKKAIAMSYPIYRQILHFFTKQLAERGNDMSWNVYNSPTLTCELQGGLIKIEEVKEK